MRDRNSSRHIVRHERGPSAHIRAVKRREFITLIGGAAWIELR